MSVSKWSQWSSFQIFGQTAINLYLFSVNTPPGGGGQVSESASRVDNDILGPVGVPNLPQKVSLIGHWNAIAMNSRTVEEEEVLFRSRRCSNYFLQKLSMLCMQ